MKGHVFEQPGRSITIDARFETEPRIFDGPVACPVCGTVVDTEALEHSIRTRPLKPKDGKTPSYILSCKTPCPKEGCPVFLKLEVNISEEEHDAWRQNVNCRLDHTYFRDNRPVSMEAQAEEFLSGTGPHRCPICFEALELTSAIPLNEVLISGVPLPRSGEPPQHRASAYASCPHCGARLTCYCFMPAEEVLELRSRLGGL